MTGVQTCALPICVELIRKPVPVDTELYDLLGVSPDASEGASHTNTYLFDPQVYSPDEIKKAYRKKVPYLKCTV